MVESQSFLGNAVKQQVEEIESDLRNALEESNLVELPIAFEVYDYNTDEDIYEGVVNGGEEKQYYFSLNPDNGELTVSELEEKQSFEEFVRAETNTDSKTSLSDLS